MGQLCQHSVNCRGHTRDECGVWGESCMRSVRNMYVFSSGWGRRCVGKWVRGLGLGFTNPVGTAEVCDVCLCLGCGDDGGGGVGEWLGPGPERLGWCYDCVCCESRYFVEMAGPGICVLCSSEVHPMLNPVAPYRYQLPNMYFSVADIANSDFIWCCYRTWICLDIACFYEEQRHPAIWSAWPACPQKW